ncbi:hypothetical protein P3T76_003233 [Phytophthora citrophthora]|uniref:Uncharacterized protein n=1 Tax=Phytophthora citrophthora TaxID=4793 RepID=A0AAD9GU84_9STRA|nr:hypothetical protein P3T76_003233 [Phytophthora citrophthora]
MKFIAFVVTFLAIACAAQAGNPQNAIQLSASAQADAEVDTPAPTPAATTFADLPTPAPTNFSDPTPAPTFPTAAPTESADVTTIEDAAQNEERSSSSTVGVVGVAYNTEGTVGVAFSTTRAEYEAENNSSTESGSGATVPIVVIGCLVGVIGMVAAVVVARKRKANVAEEGETDYANVNTPAASVKAEDAYASTIRTPAAGEAGEVEYSNAIHTPVATV